MRVRREKNKNFYFGKNLAKKVVRDYFRLTRYIRFRSNKFLQNHSLHNVGDILKYRNDALNKLSTLIGWK